VQFALERLCVVCCALYRVTMEKVQIIIVDDSYICTLFIRLCSASRVLVWNFLPTVIDYFECLCRRFSKIVPFFLNQLLKIRLNTLRTGDADLRF
jgi:hypothetical protein